jgi:hypothetical protein
MTTASLDITSHVEGAEGKPVWLVPDAALGFPLDKYYRKTEGPDPATLPGDEKVVWIVDSTGFKGEPVRVRVLPHNGKIADPTYADALSSTPYTEVEWQDGFVPTGDTRLIVAAPPPPKLIHMPNLFK